MKQRASWIRSIALVALAFCLGFLLGRHGSVEDTSANGLAAKAMTRESSTEMKDAGTSSVVKPTPDSTSSNQGDLFRPKFVSVVTELNRVLQSKISVPMLFGEELNPDFVSIYELSERETNQLKAALKNARGRLAELESRHARIEPKGPTEFTISIPTFPAEGGLVFDDLTKAIRSILGEPRHELYLQLSRYDFESTSAFGMFGLGETVINVKPMRSEQGGAIATSSMSSNQETGTMSKTLDTDPDLLDTHYPLIHQRMIATGLLQK
jgi:hypothetical protein